MTISGGKLLLLAWALSTVSRLRPTTICLTEQLGGSVVITARVQVRRGERQALRLVARVTG